MEYDEVMRRDPLLKVRNSSRSDRTRLFFATIAVLVLFIGDIFTGGALRNVMRSAVLSLSGATSAAAAAVVTSGVFASSHALEIENQDLKQKLAALEARDTQLVVNELSRSELESLAHIATGTPGISVPIVSSLIASPYGTFLIGAGTLEGVQTGNAVLLPDGYAIGRVSEVRSHTAVVEEIFAQGIITDARIGSTQVKVTGSGGQNAYAQAPRGALVQTGDIVIAPSLVRPIGVVGSVASSSAEAYQEVYIRIPDNVGAAQYVFVVGL